MVGTGQRREKRSCKVQPAAIEIREKLRVRIFVRSVGARSKLISCHSGARCSTAVWCCTAGRIGHRPYRSRTRSSFYLAGRAGGRVCVKRGAYSMIRQNTNQITQDIPAHALLGFAWTTVRAPIVNEQEDMWRSCVVCAPLCTAWSGQLNRRCALFVFKLVDHCGERKTAQTTVSSTRCRPLRTDARAVVRENYALATKRPRV